MRFIHFNSIRKRLLFIFLSFTLLITIVAILAIYFYNKSTKLSNITRNIDALLIEAMQMMKHEKDFLTQELKNTDFYKTGNSKHIAKHAVLVTSIQEKLYTLINNGGVIELDAHNKEAVKYSKQTLYELESYTENFKNFLEMIRLRGFKGEGLEGEMRRNIHKVEKNIPNNAQLLSLRRREKDYLLRREIAYAHYLEQECKSLLSLNILSGDDKKNLEKYLSSFQQIVKIEQIMYAQGNKGLQGKLTTHSEKMIQNLDKLSKIIGQKTISIKNIFRNILLFSLIATIIISIILSYYLSYYIAKPIQKLSTRVHQQVEEKMPNHKIAEAPLSADEVERLNTDFKEIIAKINKSS